MIIPIMMKLEMC